uniref:MARVEL domain-containing protein n=1 Tax=Ascaris lumbricoides TaxID=6252 RepID=A0A0M3HUY6_ASCLU
MLRAEESIERTDAPRESAIEIERVEATEVGPQSPPPPPIYEAPAPSSPNGQQQPQQQQPKRRRQINMATRIQIIPDSRQGQLNTAFLATVPGVLKIAQIVLSFISFILAICSDRNSTTAAWAEHISFEAFIVVSALLLGYVCFPHLTIKDEQTREGLIVVELLFYGINALLFFIAIWLMVHLSASWATYGRGSAIIDAILCVALTILFAIDTVQKLRAWRGENAPSSKIITTSRAGPERERHYDTTIELHKDQGPEVA